MKKIWIKKFKSFKEAEKADIEYYSQMSPKERLNTMQLLREMYFKMKGLKNDATRLRRTIKIIQQA